MFGNTYTFSPGYSYLYSRKGLINIFIHHTPIFQIYMCICIQIFKSVSLSQSLMVSGYKCCLVDALEISFLYQTSPSQLSHLVISRNSYTVLRFIQILFLTQMQISMSHQDHLRLKNIYVFFFGYNLNKYTKNKKGIFFC